MGQQEQALWFARRGYVALVVVRQGYGRSGGKQDGMEGGCGERGSFYGAGEASADDLRAAAKYMAAQPEVEASQIVSVGVSTGGFAQVALAANPPPGLKAAISFAGGRGGDGKGNNCNLGGLISAFHDFGKHDKAGARKLREGDERRGQVHDCEHWRAGGAEQVMRRHDLTLAWAAASL